ncbi:hypothetical protein MJO55_21580 [Mycolicibacterium rufum]|uniref:Uncharacterized protein n=1 Tax=Mycolicibacterium rufum TaxID=318424 RepID=A0A9X2YIF8_9MYCO|nr:hypothetical protein [Mycolicibacterium rufum]KGI69590.1 hypothetical protein EU78_21525 [Mycolicibacterium rufum]MCV7073281.1 hypothetical protein [Mycolicibacterium rufum]ULP35817.1 hypothetical protein MJO55_21580 [Mycolicibacterium rufum]
MLNAWLYVLIAVIVWLSCGVAAYLAGPERYAGRLFWLTLAFMGPLGIAAALIMKTIEDFAQSSAPDHLTPIKLAAPQSKTAPAAPPDKRKIRCPHCNAELLVGKTAARFKCVKCNEVSKTPD